MLNSSPDTLEKNHLLFDGECRFCRTCVDLISEDKKAIRFRASPYQECLTHYPEVAETAFSNAVHLKLENGRMLIGAEAVFHLLQNKLPYNFCLWGYRNLPMVRVFFDSCYRLVAEHRVFSAKILKRCLDRENKFSNYQISSSLFLKLLALIYLISFYSLHRETAGLFLSQGIAPIAEVIAFLKKENPGMNFSDFPSLFWLKQSDFFIRALPMLGMLISTGLIFFHRWNKLLIVLFFLYLSFVLAGQDFTSFQWDILLLEASFVSFFMTRRGKGIMGGAVVLLFQSLWFKLIFSSGMVKILANTPLWRNLDALLFHFESQPLPNFISPFLHFLPSVILKTFCLLALLIQVITPLGMFFGARARLYTFFINIFLQIAIFASGNFNVFNLLAIALSLFLLQDAQWSKITLRFSSKDRLSSLAKDFFLMPIILILILFNLFIILDTAKVVHFRGTLRQHLSNYGIASSYGLFSDMTTLRKEIIFEGFWDESWKEIDFKFKPGRLDVAPKQVAPLHPRLDWQMWFAALGSPYQNPWIFNLAKGILNGNREMRIFFTDYDPAVPPKKIRAYIYDYHFARNGMGWTRENKNAYLPELSLTNFKAKK